MANPRGQEGEKRWFLSLHTTPELKEKELL